MSKESDEVESGWQLCVCHAQMELDPEYDMAIGGPPPPRTLAPDLAPGEALQLLRAELCRTLGVAEGDEAGWRAMTEGAVEEAQARLRQLNIRPARDHWVRSQYVPWKRTVASTCNHRKPFIFSFDEPLPFLPALLPSPAVLSWCWVRRVLAIPGIVLWCQGYFNTVQPYPLAMAGSCNLPDEEPAWRAGRQFIHTQLFCMAFNLCAQKN